MKGQKVEPGSVDNLATLHTLDERILLEEIRARYYKEIIYTYIADILLAVNPYKKILIYGNDQLERYVDVKVRADLRPHIYAISDAAYQDMRRSGHSQCCVVSGESGSGKTESTKLLVQHIAHLCKNTNGHLHDRIVQVNPLLEAFGNAQTMINNNSSRFGKYIELNFAHDGSILGARISEYLLEKSRVVTHGMHEKNFHVFYYIFSGLTSEQLKINLLAMPEEHRILRTLDNQPVFTSEAEFNHYRQQWDRLKEIMETVGFLTDEINMILALLAAILHITDIEFSPDFDTDGVFIVREDVMEIAAELLAVLPEELAACFISNVTLLRGERIVSLKSVEQAIDGRDALAKALYGRLFGWIVRQINMMLQPDSRGAPQGANIGILDIAGFENFEINSFEQLCINAANEQLQFYFNQHIFSWELDEYKKEGVKGKDIKFSDNRPVLDLMLQTPLGLFSLLDEESRFPQSTDRTLLDKLDKNLSKKPQFKRPKSNPFMFTIIHYAGPVSYLVAGFLSKNRDTLSLNLLECMKNSDSQIVCDLFNAPISDTGALQNNPNGPKRSRQSVLLCKAKDWSYTQMRSLSKHAGKKLKEQKALGRAPMYENSMRQSLSGNFKNSLTDLMAKLLECEPHFVRCIKPNAMKMPSVFEPKLVAEQLKYTGVLETVRIRRLGYATRMPFPMFIDRYKILGYKLTQKVDPTSQNCSKLLKKIGLKDWEVGKTKVFLKYWHAEELALRLDVVGWKIVHCQRYVRGFLDRKKFKAMAALAQQDNAAVRGFCVYISNMTEDLAHNQLKQQEHDVERKQREKDDTKMAEYCRIDQIHQDLEAKQREERERMAQRALSPDRSLRPDKLRENRPLPVGPPSPTPTSVSTARVPKVKGTPTLLLLGNPVYGSNEQVFRSAQEIYGSRADFRPGLKRSTLTDSKLKPELAEKESEGMRMPINDMRKTFEENGHLTRGTPIPTAQNSSKQFFETIIAESLVRLPEIEHDIWAKIYYMERNQVISKLYLREHEIIIDNSMQEYDGFVIGMGSFENPYRDAAIEKIRSQVGKGLKLKTDAQGNIFASKLTKGDIIVKGYMDPAQHCMSEEVAGHLGRLTENPMKIFDMKAYKAHISEELRKPSIDSSRLHRLSVMSFSFIRNTFDDMDTPCWITVLNFAALNALGQEQILREVQSMTRLNIGDAEEQQMLRNWKKLDLRNPYGSTPNLTANNTWLSQTDIRNSRESTLPSGISESRPGYSGHLEGDHDIYSKGAGAKQNWAKFNKRNT